MKEYKFSRLVFQSLLSGSFYTNERSQKSKYLDEKEAEFPEQVVKVIEKYVSHPKPQSQLEILNRRYTKSED